MKSSMFLKKAQTENFANKKDVCFDEIYQTFGFGIFEVDIYL